MGHNNYYPFCIIGATKELKQYIRGKYEFLLVFSHFNNQDWQQNTLKAAKSIRQRKEIAERRPLVNFYILVSNARHLKHEIDKIKGGTEAAIIPFTFQEILSCENNDQLKLLILNRFAEYLYENNMLGEETPIEEDALLFGDRGKIADAIVQRCIEHKHSGIFGLRRSGKSSVLHAVERRLEIAKIKYINIESRSALEGIDSWKIALFDIAKGVRQSTLELAQEDGETRSQFNVRLNLNSTEEEYIKRPSQCFVEDIKLYTRNEQTFVIAIDEIELITYNTATSTMWQDLDSYKGFWGALRDSGCSLIICGVNSTINERSVIEFKGKTCDNPMYERVHNCADFSKTYLPAFTDEQTRIMINTLGGYSNVAFNYIYVDINRAFGGQPYAIRQFCAYMFDQIKELRKPDEPYEITKPTFDALLVDFCNSEKGMQLFNTILQHIAIYREEYSMLKRIALSPDKYRTVEEKDVSLIDHLEKYGLIEYDRSTLFVTFNIQSIQDYIRKISSKNPEDMNNDERRRYIQERVKICEQKLKTHIYNYYKVTGNEEAGKTLIGHYSGIIIPNDKARPLPNLSTSSWKDVFDHSKFIFYFSTIRKIISDNWRTLGKAFEEAGITREKFNVYLKDINAGRSDADHYDAEDMFHPEDWEISDITMQTFIVAYNAFEAFFNT